MNKKKTFQELTIMDNFMFGAVMADSENCRLLLERILDMPIERVEVDIEKSLTYHPNFHGVKLDAYAKDEKNTHYNIEMQVEQTPVLHRSRYYHSQIDMDLLKTSKDYDTIPDAYVIFICDYDPFKLGMYRYTFTTVLEEDNSYTINDGAHTIILNNRGTNPEEVSPELVSFLEYTKDKEDIESNDPFVSKIQHNIREIKADREMEARYMTLNLYIYEQRKEAKAEGLVEGKAEGQFELLEPFLLTNHLLNSTIKELLNQVISQGRTENLLSMILDSKNADDLEKRLLSFLTVSA